MWFLIPTKLCEGHRNVTELLQFLENNDVVLTISWSIIKVPINLIHMVLYK